jgi:hypothetical protein
VPLGLKARPWSLLARAGVVVYAAFLVTAPFEHHDFLCELKTPRHCAACTSSQLGADPHTPAILGGWHLSDAGRTVAFHPVAAGVLLPAPSTGRSPPV